MKKLLTLLLLVCLNSLFSQTKAEFATSDIDNFWIAFDKITTTTDTLQQYHYLNTFFIAKGSPGLKALMEARNYTPQEYLSVIRNYPLYWKSIRSNTLKAKELAGKIEKGIARLKIIYPELKTAPVYFTIGAMRTGGTVLNGMVLIGSEIALTDKNTVTSEFPESVRQARRTYFNSNPIHDVVLLNVHEYVHTQQKPMVQNLLSQTLYEGVAEFVSVTAMGVPSAAPAIAYGEKNEARVKKRFEQEVFNFRAQDKWLWSDRENEFGVRDLGYYIGYAICKMYYDNAKDKKQAIKKMIELDYSNETEIEEFINSTNYFSGTVTQMYDNFEKSRPAVVSIRNIENGSQAVTPGTISVTLVFSEMMDTRFTNFDYGPDGEETLLRIKKVIGFSADGKSMTFEVAPDPDKKYQLLIEHGFRDTDGNPLKPYLIEFRTTSK